MSEINSLIGKWYKKWWRKTAKSEKWYKNLMLDNIFWLERRCKVEVMQKN